MFEKRIPIRRFDHVLSVNLCFTLLIMMAFEALSERSYGAEAAVIFSSENLKLDADILEVSTEESFKFRFRAIVGKRNGKFFILIEKTALNEKGVDNKSIPSLIDVSTLPGGDALELGEGWTISAPQWVPYRLSFKN